MFHRIPTSQAVFISPIRSTTSNQFLLSWVSSFLHSFHLRATTQNFSAPNYTRNHIIEQRKGLSMLWRKKGTSLITNIDGHFLFNRSYTVCISGWRERRSIGWVHSLINFKFSFFDLFFVYFWVCVDMHDTYFYYSCARPKQNTVPFGWKGM